MEKYTLSELKKELKNLDIAIDNLSASSAKYALVSQAMREIREEIKRRENGN